jgi:hypothetical protein
MTAFQPKASRWTASVVLVLLAMSSCASTPTARDLTGMWESQETAGTKETFCFSGDGSLDWTSQVHGRTVRHRGTYKLAGDALTFQTPDIETAPTLRASLQFGKLALTSPSGSTQKYMKVSGSCDDKGR